MSGGEAVSVMNVCHGNRDKFIDLNRTTDGRTTDDERPKRQKEANWK